MLWNKHKVSDNYAKKSLSGIGKHAAEGSALTNTGYRSDYNCITVAACCLYKTLETNITNKWAVLSSSLGLETCYS
jgi:hypothetical protein